MELKQITNDDFDQLIELNARMYKEIDPNINSFGAVNTLVAFVNTGKFLALGIYEDDVLLGFSAGHAIGESAVFMFTSIYMSVKNTDLTQQLIDFSFDFIKEKGYTGWQVDATNPNISSIMEKYGARVLYTRYIKEFE